MELALEASVNGLSGDRLWATKRVVVTAAGVGRGRVLARGPDARGVDGSGPASDRGASLRLQHR